MQPGHIIGGTPESNIGNNVFVLPEQAEDFLVALCLSLQHFLGGLGQIGAAIMKFEHGQIHLGYMEYHTQLSVFLNSFPDYINGRPIDVPVGLEANTVNGNVLLLQALYQLVDLIALGGLAFVVVVVEQEGIGICLMGNDKGLFNKVLTDDLEPRRSLPQNLWARILHRFIHHVPAVNGVFVALHNSLGMLLDRKSTRLNSS